MFWTKADGTKIDVKAMEDSHIENCLAMIQSDLAMIQSDLAIVRTARIKRFTKSTEAYLLMWKDAFLREQKRRKEAQLPVIAFGTPGQGKTFYVSSFTSPVSFDTSKVDDLFMHKGCSCHRCRQRREALATGTSKSDTMRQHAMAQQKDFVVYSSTGTEYHYFRGPTDPILILMSDRYHVTHHIHKKIPFGWVEKKASEVTKLYFLKDAKEYCHSQTILLGVGNGLYKDVTSIVQLRLNDRVMLTKVLHWLRDGRLYYDNKGR